jgi:hypothetical protein
LKRTSRFAEGIDQNLTIFIVNWKRFSHILYSIGKGKKTGEKILLELLFPDK